MQQEQYHLLDFFELRTATKGRKHKVLRCKICHRRPDRQVGSKAWHLLGQHEAILTEQQRQECLDDLEAVRAKRRVSADNEAADATRSTSSSEPEALIPESPEPEVASEDVPSESPAYEGTTPEQTLEPFCPSRPAVDGLDILRDAFSELPQAKLEMQQEQAAG